MRGYILVNMGGTASLMGKQLHQLRQLDRDSEVPIYIVNIDTEDPKEDLIERGIIDQFISLRLEHEQINALKASPMSFGRIAANIIRSLPPELLSPQGLTHGARTIRAITQLMMEVKKRSIAAVLNRCLLDFQHRYGLEQVIPIHAGGSGGGSGSALLVLLPALYRARSFRALMLQGMAGSFLAQPISFVAEPFFRALANSRNPQHASRILANAMAFRIESALLERHSCFDYIFHLGLSSTGGAVLDNEQEVASVLATTVYTYLKHYSAIIKPRTVNDPDVGKFNTKYAGTDTIEGVQKPVSPPNVSPKIVPPVEASAIPMATHATPTATPTNNHPKTATA